jgi:sensor c-di-GMP phosphodiesterase-like protein
MLRRLFVPIALILGGAFTGIVLGYFVARFFQTRSGTADLKEYTQRLIRSGTQLSLDADVAHAAMMESRLPFCSDEEISLMRAVVFGSRTVKEIERIRDGKVECTAALGRLPKPTPITHVQDTFQDFKLYGAASITASGIGFISQRPGTAVVMNPVVFQDLDEPPMIYAGRYYSAARGSEPPAITGEFGHSISVSDSELRGGKLLERNGVTYLPQCAPNLSFCVIAAEPRTAMLKKSHWMQIAALCFGAFGGACFSAVPLLFMHRQRSLESQLRRAVRDGDLRMVYQPVLDFTTGAITGAEALVRWRNEADELVRPDIFIAIAEDRGFIEEITRFAIQCTVSELKGPLGLAGFRVAVNISAQDLANPDFCNWLTRELAAAGVPPQAIALEITERTTLQHNAAAVIQILRSAGHPIYLDDFGTGYSSLSYLHQLNISAIKIDRTFTHTVGTESVTATVVPQILSIARELDLAVVVEGVETEAQAAYFRKAGPGILGQGFYLGHPVPAPELRNLLSHAG